MYLDFLPKLEEDVTNKNREIPDITAPHSAGDNEYWITKMDWNAKLWPGVAPDRYLGRGARVGS